MATSAVLTIAEINRKLSGYMRELRQATAMLSTLKANADAELADPEGSASYAATKLQMDAVYTLVKNTSDALASFISDEDFWVYPYVWTAGASGNLNNFVVVADAGAGNGTITAKAAEPVAATLTNIFADLAAGDYVKISGAEDAGNNGVKEVVSAASGVLTVSGTLTANAADTTMSIALFHKVT